jgi:hypothetical protein
VEEQVRVQYIDTERHSLLLHATCCEGGGAPVAHYGLQPGGADDVEAPARPGASSQLCSKSQKKAWLDKASAYFAFRIASCIAVISNERDCRIDFRQEHKSADPADLYKLLNFYGIRECCAVVGATSLASEYACAPSTDHLNHLNWKTFRGYSARR